MNLKKNRQNLVKNAELSFMKIVVGSKDSLTFHKEIFAALGYDINDNSENMFIAKGQKSNFLVYHGSNMVGSGVWLLDTGVSAQFFKVENKKAVNEFCKKVLDPRQIKPRPNNKHREEEGKYGIFFDTPEKITIGVISYK
jgi:hypothetical protein